VCDLRSSVIGTPSIVNVIPKGTALARCLLNKKAVCSHLDQVLVKQEIHRKNLNY
jgi:hypothetical protein